MSLTFRPGVTAPAAEDAGELSLENLARMDLPKDTVPPIKALQRGAGQTPPPADAKEKRSSLDSIRSMFGGAKR